MTESVSADVVERIDPDWRDNFSDVEAAFEFYQLHAHREFAVAYREVTGEEWHSDDV